MITVSILGLDPYVVRGISKDVTPKLADIYETSKDKINFYCPECLYIHDGVEQNTWNILVKVEAPMKVKVMEKEACKILHQFLKDACINMEIIFNYYSQDNYYEFINNEHPRFMTEENLVYEEDYDDECQDEDEEGTIEHYLGNVFEGFKDKINGKGK